MNNTLTQKQEEVYKAIYNFIKQNEYAPTIRELCEICGQNSPATMYVHLQKLEKKGYISQVKGKSRTIKLLRGKYE